MRIIGLFFPAFISVLIKHSRNLKSTWQMPEVLAEYGIYTLVNVLLTTALITYGLNVSGVTVDALDSFPFFTKYMAIAIIMAVLTPYVEEMIKKYIKVTFTVRTNDEKDEDNTEKHTKNN